MLDSGNLRLGGVHLDVGLDLAQLRQDLDSAGAQIQRWASQTKASISPRGPGGAGAPGASAPAAGVNLSGLQATIAYQTGAIVGALDRGLGSVAATVARTGLEIVRSLDAAIDRLRGIEHATEVVAAGAKGTMLAGHDLYAAERGEFHRASSERLFERARGNRIPLTRKPGYLQNLPADVRYLASAGFESPVGLDEGKPGAARASAPAGGVASSIVAGLTRAGDHLTGAGLALQAAANALIRAAAPKASAARPGVTSNAFTSGGPATAHPAGGVPIPVGSGYFDPDRTVPVGKSIDPVTGLPSGAAYYRRRPGMASGGTPPIAGQVAPGMAIDPFGGIVGGNIGGFRNFRGRSGSVNLGAIPAALRGIAEGSRRAEAALASFGHAGALGVNRVLGSIRAVERQMGRVAITTRPLRAVIGGAFTAATAPLTFGMRALGLWDHRAGAATNTLRLLGRTASTLATPLTAPFRAANEQVGRLNVLMRGAVQGIVAFGTAAALGMAVKGVRAAADLAESVNAVKTVFKGSAPTVTGFADQMADRFGLVKRDVLDAETRIGGVLKNSGFGTKQAAQMGNVLTQRAADITSQRNPAGGLPEVMAAMDSALSGRSTEPISRFGIMLDEETVKAKALAMGLAQSTAEVGRTARAQAAYALILEQSSDAEGDLARTGTSIKNLMRDLQGRFENSAAALGSKLAPAFNELLLLFQELFVGSKRATATVHDWVGGVVDGVVQAIRFARQLWEAWDAGTQLVGVLFLQMGENAADAFAWIGDVVGSFLGWFGKNWTTVWTDAIEVVLTLLTNLGTNFRDFGTALADYLSSGFQDEFKFKFTAITEGMAPLQTPAFEVPELKFSGSYEKELGDLWAKITNTEVRIPTTDAERKPVDEDGNPLGKDGKDKSKKDVAGSLIGAREMLELMQRSVFDKDSKNLDGIHKTAREQLKKLDEISRKRPAAVMS